jgi:predicted acyltransferase
MILSGSIAFGDVLPAWMYHAQVPPPDHTFTPAIAGITWVDLVFPFFLFSMGAAIPMALQKYRQQPNGWLLVTGIAIRRFVLLAFFALFTQHLKAWVIADNPDNQAYALSVFAFVLLFFQLYEPVGKRYQRYFLVGKVLAYAMALCLLWVLPFHAGKGFDFYKSDIIIMVLANMALFGTLIYFATADKPIWRLALLPFVMAIFLAAKEPADGWAKALFQFSHIGSFRFDWLYKFYFLKYLFIVIPGTLAGEWMLEQQRNKAGLPVRSKPYELWAALLSVLLVVCNLYGLFTRQLLLNLCLSAGICVAIGYLQRNTDQYPLHRKWHKAGASLLLLGLCFEGYEGGIHKDPSTYSYYFVTSGLAFFSLIALEVMSNSRYYSTVTSFLARNGQNPMVAYVAGNLLLLPILALTGLQPYWEAMAQNAWMGFLKGVLFTGVVSLITIFFVRQKWFWKS